MALLALFSPLPFIQINASGVHRDLCSSRRQEDPSKSLFPCSLLFLIAGLKGPLNYTAVVVKSTTTWSETWFHLESLGFCDKIYQRWERVPTGQRNWRVDSKIIPPAGFDSCSMLFKRPISIIRLKYTEINLMNWMCKNPSQKWKMGLWLKDVTDQC